MVSFSVKFDTKRLLKRLDAIPEILREEAEAFSEELGEIAVDSMQQSILRSGTDFSVAARKVGLNKGPGRYRTGAMFDSIDYRVESGPKLTRLVFGYLRSPQDYFDIQEGADNPKGSFRNIYRGIYSTKDGSLLLRKDGGPRVRKRKRGGYKNTATIQGLRQAMRDIDQELPRLLKKYRARITRRSNRAK
jgi:hypothetical protein